MAHGVASFYPAALLAERRRRGWSQDELAERSGLSQGTVSAMERGQSRPTVRTLRMLASALGVPADLLLRQSSGPGLAGLRLRAGFTQHDVADRIGMSVTTYATLERSGSPVPAALAARLAAALGTTEDAVRRCSRPSAADPPPAAATPPHAVRRTAASSKP